jgi:hypothetical protein
VILVPFKSLNGKSIGSDILERSRLDFRRLPKS